MSATKSLHPDEKIKASKLGNRLFAIGAGAGLVLLLLGILLGSTIEEKLNSHYKWQRFFYAYLTGWAFVTSISIGSVFFILTHHVARAKWAIVLRRLAEFMAGALPVLFLVGLGFIIPVVAGYDKLYFWSEPSGHQADHPLYHHLHNKLGWFDPLFFAARYVIYFVILIGVSRYFINKSREQDESSLEHAAHLHERMRVWSGVSILICAITVAFFGFDLLMSLSPTWYSTIYSVNFFAGSMLAAYCMFALFAAAIQRSGRLTHSITTEHYHDIGKYMFGWTFFWIYTAFSQFMLQWYGNIPEETIFYQYRMFSEWQWVSWAVLIGHWALPYLALVTRWTKRILPLLMALAVWQLVFHYVDLYWNVMPNQQWLTEGKHILGPLQGDPEMHRIQFHAVDIVMLLSMVALFLAGVGRAMKGNLLPVNDPKLPQSLAFENY
jgi:hypothetical protein